MSATVSEFRFFPKIVAMCFNQDSQNEIAQQIALCRKERSTDSNPVVQIQVQLQILIHIRYTNTSTSSAPFLQTEIQTTPLLLSPSFQILFHVQQATYQGSCTYYVITDGGGLSPNDYSITQGVSSQMITILHRGGLVNDHHESWVYITFGISFPKT